MKNIKFIKPISEKEEIKKIDPIELLLDPIRSKILFEALLKGSVTAERLVEVTGKSRSTISHHLRKLVESGLLEVYMNPIGKTKYYKINASMDALFYRFDRKELISSPIEESSAFLVELLKTVAVINQVFANLFSEQVKQLEKMQPFERIIIEEDDDISFQVKGRRNKIPYQNFLLLDEEEMEFINDQLKILMKKYLEKFGFALEDTLNKASQISKPKYLFSFQLYPYIDTEELQE